MATNSKPGTLERGLERAAIGLRAHSGWAALVAIGGPIDSPSVIERRQITLADRAIAGSSQPYHFAERLGGKKAESFVNQSIHRSRGLACHALDAARSDLRERGHKVVACGLLVGSSRPLPPLAGILSSHALIHAAEGIMFRDVLAYAGKRHQLPVVEVRERELFDRCQDELSLSSGELDCHLAEIGRALGPPWREDQKYAMLVAWIALMRHAGSAVSVLSD